MMRPPTSRVDTPQLVAQAYSSLPGLVLELDVERLGEVLAQEMARARLQGLAVLHHRLDAQRVHRSGKLLALALGPRQHRHGHPFLGEGAIDVEHPPRLFLRLGLRGVGGVAFLPEELGRAQEQPGAHLPAHDVAPLVDEQRQIAIALNPVACTCAR